MKIDKNISIKNPKLTILFFIINQIKKVIIIIGNIMRTVGFVALPIEAAAIEQNPAYNFSFLNNNIMKYNEITPNNKARTSLLIYEHKNVKVGRKAKIDKEILNFSKLLSVNSLRILNIKNN